MTELKLVRQCVEWQRREKWAMVPRGIRGIYTLLKEGRGDRFDVVYVGLSATDIQRRLKGHAQRKSKWTHFSVFVVWPNITDAEIEELEGLFRHIYRKDSRANRINKQRAFNKLYKVRVKHLGKLRAEHR